MDGILCAFLLTSRLLFMVILALFAYALCMTTSGADAHIVRYESEKESNAKDSGR
jgi:hypothetical protein